jgi:ribonuclease HI
MNNTIKIYADGACRGNQFAENIGGYGVVLLYGEHKKELKDAFKNVTNNQMEILSVIEGLKALKTFDLPIEIYSDSQYVVNTINLNWNKKANQDLWAELYNYIEKAKDIKFIKVKGHSDNEFNNRADKLANEAMDALK